MSVPSESVATNVVLYAIFLAISGSVVPVVQFGVVPAVIALLRTCRLDPVGLVIPGFSTTTLYVPNCVEKVSGLVTINWELDVLTIDFAARSTLSEPTKYTATFEAKFPPVMVVVSSI